MMKGMGKTMNSSLIPTLMFVAVGAIILYLSANTYSQGLVSVPMVLSSGPESYAVIDAENFSTGERVHTVLRVDQPHSGKGYQLILTESDFSTYGDFRYISQNGEEETARVYVGKPQLFGSTKFTITGFTSTDK